MEGMAIKIILLAIFVLVMVGVGIYCRKKATDVNGFVLGGRSVGPWLTAFAYGTSYFSAVIFIGYAGQFGWKFGVASTWIGLGNAFIGSLLAWVILGRRTRIMTQHLQSKTMPEFFEKRYDSKALKIASSVIIFIFLIPYTASLFNGLSRLFEMAFNVEYVYCVIAMSVLTGIYVVVGGYMATAINDFIQGIIMLFGIVAVVLAVLKTQGGFMEAITSLSQIPAEGVAQQGAFTSFFGPNPLELLGVVLLTSLGTWGLPQMVQKFYSIRKESDISKGTLISTIFAIIVAGGCYFLGGFGRLFLTDEQVATGGFDAIIPAMLQNLPAILIAIVVILVLSASMSTLSSLVLTSSSTITLDLIDEVKKNKLSEKKKLSVMRIFVVFFIVVSAGLAIIQAKSQVTFIAQLMGISWGALAGAFLAPFMYGLYMKKVSKLSVWLCFASGVVIMSANMIGRLFFADAFAAAVPQYLQSPLNAGVFAMVIGLVIVPVVSLLTKCKNRDKINEVFSCFDKEVTVNIKDSLENK